MKFKILIVDDDITIADELKELLVDDGHEVQIVNSGEDALKIHTDNKFDIVFLDIKLPDMEGTQLLAKLHETTPKMVKIMVTGYPSIENAMEALNQGADAYVTKPVKPAKLLALIKEKLEEQQQAEKMTENKVTDWINTRAHQLEP